MHKCISIGKTFEVPSNRPIQPGSDVLIVACDLVESGPTNILMVKLNWNLKFDKNKYWSKNCVTSDTISLNNKYYLKKKLKKV